MSFAWTILLLFALRKRIFGKRVSGGRFSDGRNGRRRLSDACKRLFEAKTAVNRKPASAARHRLAGSSDNESPLFVVLQTTQDSPRHLDSRGWRICPGNKKKTAIRHRMNRRFYPPASVPRRGRNAERRRDTAAVMPHVTRRRTLEAFPAAASEIGRYGTRRRRRGVPESPAEAYGRRPFPPRVPS